ncbi:MAG: zinc carboxypeptidase, partial [Bdellovibrionales bacterium]|nr:zinc carboxypeptidase [Bdellovibrionales bacterium]
DFQIFQTMAGKMAEWNGYEPTQGSDLYVVSGNTIDWSYGELGLISFTFEL